MCRSNINFNGKIMIRKQLFIYLFILVTFSISVSEAIEFEKTPLQDEFRDNILLADRFTEVEKPADEPYVGSNQKSMGRAILYSALIPGWGEHYAGQKKKARFFFAAEVATWVAYFSYRSYGKWRKDDMFRYASEKAGADLNDKDDQFYDMVGFYENLDEYNSLGRVSDPDRPYYYDTTNYYWHWNSSDDRNEYREIKNSYRAAYKNSETIIGLAVLSRLFSVIDAIRDVRKHNRHIGDAFSKQDQYKIEINPFSENRQFQLTVYTPF